MKKTIIIMECDMCSTDLIKRHDSIYYVIEKDAPGWVSGYKYPDDESFTNGTVLCMRCFDKYIGKFLKK